MDNDGHQYQKEVTHMTQEQPTPIDTRSDYGRAARRAARTQERHERWLAKQAAREARRAARAQRPHRDWSFEVRVGDQVYTFTWHWHALPQVEVQAATA